MSLEPLPTLSLYLGAFLGTVVLSEMLRRTRLEAAGSKNVTRITLGLMLATSPIVSAEAWPVLAIAALVSLVMAVTWSRGGLKGMHGDKRDSVGTAATPIAFLFVLIGWFSTAPWIPAVSMAVVTIADPMGAWIGRFIDGQPIVLWKDPKTLQGSVAVGVTAGITAAIAMYLSAPIELLQGPILATTAISVGVVTAVTEALSRQGSDNLTIPVVCALTLTLMLQHAASGNLADLVMVLFAASSLSWLGYILRLLTAGGASIALLIGFFLFGVAGWSGAAPLLTFFFGASVLSKIADRIRGKERDAKGSRRDLVQVVSNGGAAALLAIAGLLGSHPAWYAGCVGALATASADTWATDTGRLSGARPRRITTMDRVGSGTSGGVTLYGITGSVVGAAVVVMSAQTWLPNTRVAAMLIFISTACALLDSFLGDTLQARYRDPEGQVREYVVGRRDVVSGVPWMDNDVVNLLVTGLGGLLGFWVGIRWG